MKGERAAPFHREIRTKIVRAHCNLHPPIFLRHDPSNSLEMTYFIKVLRP